MSLKALLLRAGTLRALAVIAAGAAFFWGIGFALDRGNDLVRSWRETDRLAQELDAARAAQARDREIFARLRTAQTRRDGLIRELEASDDDYDTTAAVHGGRAAFFKCLRAQQAGEPCAGGAAGGAGGAGGPGAAGHGGGG